MTSHRPFSRGYDRFTWISEGLAASAALWLALVRLNVGLTVTEKIMATEWFPGPLG